LLNETKTNIFDGFELSTEWQASTDVFTTVTERHIRYLN